MHGTSHHLGNGAVQAWELDSVSLVGLFQPNLFHDSVNNCYYDAHKPFETHGSGR